MHWEVDSKRMGGKPTLPNTRFTVASLLAELLDESEDRLLEVCNDFDLDYDDAKKVMQDVANFFDRSWANKEHGE